MKPAILLICSTILLGYGPIGHAAPSDSRSKLLSEKCEAAPFAELSRLPDAPTRILSAELRPKDSIRPRHCKLSGTISPSVGFVMALPSETWNGKFLQLGCGGACGNTTRLEVRCAAPMRRGYACIVFDAGHSGSDPSWAASLEAQVDFGYRSIHVTAVAGKELIKRFYGELPRHSYFMGASTGGRQALIAAQRFPWDFDGIISGAPWINDTASSMNMLWAHRALRGPNGKPIMGRGELRTVHRAAMAQCDMDDNIRDGLISDPGSCAFDPLSIVCSTKLKQDCISGVQAEAVRKIYRGPTDSSGKSIYPGGAAIGSELGWIDEGVLDYIRSDGSEAGSEGWAALHFRHLTMPPAGPDWKVTDFDFDEDYKRFASRTQESLLNASNPDLRKFKAAGGKMIIYQGWDDQSDVPAATIDYYEAVTRVMGGQATTRDFVRLFMIPGMAHVTGGTGAYAIDYLSYLEKWVERNEAPDKLIGAHIDDKFAARLGRESRPTKEPDKYKTDGFLGARLIDLPLAPSVPVAFTRPIFAYPATARYRGTGDPRLAESFVPSD